jgi:ABC-type glycerol-3-phosphate transport system permease component
MKRKHALLTPLMIIVTLLLALPLLLAIINAFKPNEMIIYHPFALPDLSSDIFVNFKKALNRPDRLVQRGVLNSIFIVTISVIIIVILSSMTGYYLARHSNRRSKLMQLLFLAGLMVPIQITLIPMIRFYGMIGLLGTYPGLITVMSGGGLLAFAVFIYSGFIKTIPRELDEAAIIDGASDLRLFWQIIFPLVRPATASVIIFLSLFLWNDFLQPYFILGPAKGMTATMGIYILAGSVGWSPDYGQSFAIIMMVQAPILILFFFMQKHFIAGLTGGALKS